ncbi:hypothetical protein K491DRAFT_670882 [Lophiostoma macrostomum CBS 122681]|uniref:Uncharacterized protein n=1 Tax=Lophiostoma macrostomum CBS 122681 TaxID=1314788 RepID=A0A6A6SMQ3_9PLEO|nr:hypothetical protein K491DRAFT_670882 [Lophiostoma macrostomum CBS 122681]
MAPSPQDYSVTPTPYPAKSHTTSTSIKGVETVATSISFADKILITISQHGRLAHWIHVPLDISATDASLTSTPYNDQDSDDDTPPSDLLPLHHLTATTILGGMVPELGVLGQTIATQIASAVLTRDPGEKRMVVVGLGLDASMSGRKEFSELVGLVLGVL